MKIIQYPETSCSSIPVFLGGSTAKGDWQKLVEAYMVDTNATLINTCRPDWDLNSPTQAEKEKHMIWEFNWLDRSSFNFICIPADAKSPTVLLELGIAISKAPRVPVIVFIDPSYSHFENARVACKTVNVGVHTDFDKAMYRLKNMFLTM